MLTMKQLASLEKRGEVEKGALRLKVGGKSMHFSMERSKVGGEVEGFCFITPGGDGRPW